MACFLKVLIASKQQAKPLFFLWLKNIKEISKEKLPGMQYTRTHPVKIDLDKKLDSKEQTIQTFNIDAQGFRKTRNENPPMLEIGVAS